jgi:integrase
MFDKLTPFSDTPKKERIQDKFLETEEMNALLDAMTEKRWVLVSRALLLSGLRIGEFCALDKIDVKGQYIHVTKTYDANNKVVTSAKTFDSKRDVFIQEELREVLDEIAQYTKWQAQVCGYDSLIFFPDVDGGRLHYDSYAKYLRETSEKALQRRISPHTLRHSHASMLAREGVPLEQISRRLGHSDSRITKEIYLHQMKELKDRENARLNALHLIG